MSQRQNGKPAQLRTIGERIAHARRSLAVTAQRDISPAELARMLDVPASTISRIENGERQPGEPLLLRIAAVLGVLPAYLRYGEPPMAPLHDASQEAVNADHGHTKTAKRK